MIKDVKGFEGLYQINDNGDLFAIKSNVWRKPWITTTSKYLNIDLWKNGKRYKKQIHRLVAEAFVPNPNNFPVVDHIDDDITNNKSSNLQWLTQSENVRKSYNTMSPTRNFINCELYCKDNKIGAFKSIRECSRFASIEYNLSESMLNKHLKHKEYYIIKV